MNEQELKDAHNFSSYHKSLIDKSKLCGCFYCRRTFESKEIYEWIDRDQTALCPKCGIDSVIPEATGLLKQHDFLKQMSDYWFSVSNSKAYKVIGDTLIEVESDES